MELKIASQRCTDASGRQHSFHYYLTIAPAESRHTFFEEYGVCIREDLGDSAAIPAITSSASRIDELLTLLVENRVSPAGLSDVVADWL